MSFRFLFAFVVVGFWTCSFAMASAGPLDCRPSQATQGTDAAYVMHVQGQADVVDESGFEFTVFPCLKLLRSDRIKVAAGGYILLVFPNDYLARVDDEVSMKVDEFVAVDLPKASESLEQQLGRIISSSELAPTERVIGYHARKTAAGSAPAQVASHTAVSPPGKRASVEEKKKSVSSFLESRRKAEPVQVAVPMELDDSVVGSIGGGGGQAGLGSVSSKSDQSAGGGQLARAPAEAGSSKRRRQRAKSKSKSKPGKLRILAVEYYLNGKVVRPKPLLPSVITKRLRTHIAARCLREVLTSHKSKSRKSTLRFKVDAGRIQGVNIGGYKLTEACFKLKGSLTKGFEKGVIQISVILR